jgi:hypothetical protein
VSGSQLEVAHDLAPVTWPPIHRISVQPAAVRPRLRLMRLRRLMAAVRRLGQAWLSVVPGSAVFGKEGLQPDPLTL